MVLLELFALRSLDTEEETLAAIEEVAVGPSPDLVDALPGIDVGMRRLIATALAKGSAERPSAEALGLALDQWCADQGTPGSPDRLQAYLATLCHDQLPLSVARAIGPPHEQRALGALVVRFRHDAQDLHQDR